MEETGGLDHRDFRISTGLISACKVPNFMKGIRLIYFFPSVADSVITFIIMLFCSALCVVWLSVYSRVLPGEVPGHISVLVASLFVIS